MKMIEIKPPSRLKCFPLVLNRDINLFRLLNVAQNPRLVSFEGLLKNPELPHRCQIPASTGVKMQTTVRLNFWLREANFDELIIRPSFGEIQILPSQSIVTRDISRNRFDGLYQISLLQLLT